MIFTALEEEVLDTYSSKNDINIKQIVAYKDNPLEYARLYLDGIMQMWIDAEDSLELW